MESVHATKTCRTCGETTPIGEFDRRADSGNPSTQCKACRRTYQNHRNLRLNAKKPPPARVAGVPGLLTCTRCGVAKPANAFPLRHRGLPQLQWWCRECFAKANAANYARNREREILRLTKKTDAVRREVRDRIRAHLLAHPCVDCGQTDVDVLEFDHVGTKLMEVSRLRSLGYRWKVIAAEISQCEVRCGNCHRRKTHQRRLDGLQGSRRAVA